MDKLSLVHRLCSLYPGEIKQTVKFVLVASLTFATTYGSSTLLDGLFLDRVGAGGLPIVYFCTSIVCLLLASPTLQALTRFSARKLFCVFTFGGVLFFSLGALLLAGGAAHMPSLFWYICSIAGEVYLIVMYTQVWAFIDHCFDIHDAKRLYGLFHASALLGAAGGSLLISTLAHTFSPSGFFTLFAVLILVVFAFAVNMRRVSHQADTLRTEAETKLSLSNFLRQISRSRYVICLLAFNTTMLLLQVLTEYNYLSSVEVAFGGNESSAATIAAFIGKCRAWVFLGMALFGALFFSRMISKLGLRRSIIIPPLYFVTLYGAWLLGDGLMMGVLGIIAVEGVLAGMEDSNFHLLINSVDRKLKAKLRVTAEQVLEPSAMLIGSSVLLICQHGSKIIGLSLSISALCVVFLLRAALPAITHSSTPENRSEENLDGPFPQHVI